MYETVFSNLEVVKLQCVESDSPLAYRSSDADHALLGKPRQDLFRPQLRDLQKSLANFHAMAFYLASKTQGFGKKLPEGIGQLLYSVIRIRHRSFDTTNEMKHEQATQSSKELMARFTLFSDHGGSHA